MSSKIITILVRSLCPSQCNTECRD